MFQQIVKALSPAEYEIPAWMGEKLDRGLYKAAGHKYIRRVATGNPKKPYRYLYTVAGGHGIGHESEFQVGSAFRMKHDGKDGHFHIVGKTEDGKLRIKHDESGHEEAIEAAALFESLAVNHPFVDGNKRVAFAACDVFLRINGWRLQRSPKQIHADMMRMFDSGSFDIAHLEPWLRRFAQPAE